MKNTQRQKGFAGIEFVLVGIVIVLAGFVVMRAVSLKQANNSAPAGQEATVTPDALTAAEKELDSQSLSLSAEESQLDAELADF